MIRNREGKAVSQFHIFYTNDTQLLLSEVIFTERFFNVLPVTENRVVLGIWANDIVATHICLVFAEVDDARKFYNHILPYIQKNVQIYELPAVDLFGADISD